MKSVPQRGSVWLLAAWPHPVRKAFGFPHDRFLELLRLRLSGIAATVVVE
jgi:hypothetical protein